jgi:hypothetical protein
MSSPAGIFIFLAIVVILVVVTFIIRQRRNDRLGAQHALDIESENADVQSEGNVEMREETAGDVTQGQDTSRQVRKSRSFAPAWIIVIVTVICILQLMTVLYFKSQGEH